MFSFGLGAFYLVKLPSFTAASERNFAIEKEKAKIARASAIKAKEKRQKSMDARRKTYLCNAVPYIRDECKDSIERLVIPSRFPLQSTPYVYGTENLKLPNKLDIVICLNCIASTGRVIQSCQDAVVAIVSRITKRDRYDLRYCIIPCRDHHYSEEYCTEVYSFTWDKALMLEKISSEMAHGVADSPVAVSAALYETLRLDYRKEATKIVLLMTDTAPQSIESYGDRFPDGDPYGKDPLLMARALAARRITLHAITANAGLSQTCKELVAAMSGLTGGQYVHLNDCRLLADMITGDVGDSLHVEPPCQPQCELNELMMEVEDISDGSVLTVAASVLKNRRPFDGDCLKGGKGWCTGEVLYHDHVIPLSARKLGDIPTSCIQKKLKEAGPTRKCLHYCPGNHCEGESPLPPLTDSMECEVDDLSSGVTRMVMARGSRHRTDAVLVSCVTYE